MKVEFKSLRYKNLRVVLDPKTKHLEGGQLVSGSLYKKFPNGFTAEFTNGLCIVADKDVAEALEKHPDYGVQFFRLDDTRKVVLSDEAMRKQNEKKEISEDVSSTCTVCGKKCANSSGLSLHMRVHENQ